MFARLACPTSKFSNSVQSLTLGINLFSLACPKAKTKVVSKANHNDHAQCKNSE